MKSFHFSYILLLTGALLRSPLATGQDSLHHDHAAHQLHQNSPVGIMFDHIMPKGSWMVSYRFMNAQESGNYSGSSAINDGTIYQNYLMSPGTMNMNMHMLMAMVGISDHLTLMTMLHYNNMTMDMHMLPSTMEAMPGMTTMNPNMQEKSSGIGDTKVYALFNGLKTSSNLIFTLGLSLPTGSIQQKGNPQNLYANLRLPYSMQLGSGTVDLLPGVAWSSHGNRFSWGAQSTAAIRTYYNSVGYKLGNEWSITGWTAYKINNLLSTSLRLAGDLSGRVKGSDPTLFGIMEPSASPSNYGGQRVTAFGGLNVYFPDGILHRSRIAIEYGLPVYQYVNGIQPALQSTWYAGWQWTF
jgi:hypothetical protein